MGSTLGEPMATNNGDESGSRWRRWNPHIHAPGTLLADQFADDWEKYLKAIEDATPVVEVLGITDYSCIECYKSVKEQRELGRLPNVKMLFPNVEFRMSVETEKHKGINLHLMFSPDDEDHVQQIERALLALSFEFNGHPHRCSVAELAILGRAHNSKLSDELAARREGANQFKVELVKFRELFRNNKWVAQNCIVGVASKSNDGTAGLQGDAGFAAMRKEIERFAQVIYCSNQKTRDFWLGKSADDLKKLEQTYGGRKPCLHGCDAHSVARTCLPDDARYCWIKGDPTFESLRQTLLEPDERVWIGPSAPDRHDASQCIASISTRETPWIQNAEIPLNSGLVAIIGSRGSGKTALADIIAIGADVTSPLELQSSFIYRATWPANHLNDAVVDLRWGDGTSTTRWLSPQNYESGNDTVRYLSQQFVEQLCSAEGLAVELRKEIERVVFDATDTDDRYNAETFEELAEIHLKPIRRQRDVAKEAIENTSDQVNTEDALHNRIPAIKKEQEERKARIQRYTNEMKTLVPKDKEARAARLATLEAAVTTANTVVERLNRAKLRVENLRAEVGSIRKTTAPQMLAELKESFEEAGLSPGQWESFGLIFKGDVDAILTERIGAITREVKLLSEGGAAPVDLATDPMLKWPLKTLIAERNKAKEAVGIDGQKQVRYEQLQKALGSEEKAQQKSAEDFVHAQGAAERRKGHIERRRALYVQVFQSYLDEQQVLEELYAPLQKALTDATGSLKRLRLTVSREIGLKEWVRKGEELVDLRKDSKLRGHGALEKEVERMLMPAWRTGTAEQVGEAMQEFIKEMYQEIRNAMPSDITPEQETVWTQQIGTWLYSTNHVKMRYGVTYDCVAIEQLSPGTRGIVLLLLYLVIDQQDRRPLIIDQPEENLDPKSVFDELVPHFRAARKRRQVIIVTHNANLVVNTDADQVIVASSEPNPGGGLPNVIYRCGSLEAPDIRTTVCEILEGGEQAFMERERRYRLNRAEGQELAVGR